VNLYTHWIIDMSNSANSPQQSDAVILARLDERTRAMSDQLGDVKKGQADLKEDFEHFKDEIDGRIAKDRDGYVTRDEFGPVRAIAYGIVGVTLLAVIGALVALVVKGPGVVP
jgi:hypothetical protein